VTRDSFIARWSRLKGEAAQEGAASPPPAVPPADPPAVPPAADAPVERPPLTAAEIAALPPVETLTPLSDIAPFLRKGVPALLRNAALRRMWTLNPAIRDYVDDAMEYAMDWNTPGAIVGNGPLNAGDDPLAMARRLMDGARAPQPEPEAAQPERIAEPAPAPETASPPTDAAKDAAEDVAAAGRAPGADDAAAPDAVRRRRHGGAAPS